MGTVTTAQAYGAPPVSLTAMTAGATVGANPNAHPAIKWGASTYALILIAVAALYFIRGRKL